MPYPSIIIQPGRVHRAPGYLAWLCVFAAAAGYRFFAAFPVTRNADDANNLLAGRELVHGNWLLHGWRLAPDNFAPTDILAQGLASLMLGYRPVLIDAVEALIWSATAIVAISLAIRDIESRTRWLAALVTVALVIFVCPYADPRDAALTGVGSHGSTILLSLLAFRSATGHRPAPLTCWVTIGSFADPLFIVIGALPMLATCLLHRHSADPRPRGLAIASSIVAGLLLSRLLLALVHAAGGFASQRLPVEFAGFDAMLDHVRLGVYQVTALFGADFFGRTVSRHLLVGPLPALLRLPFVIALGVVLVGGAAGLVRALRVWPAPDIADRTLFLDQLLWISMLFCLAGSVLTTVMVDHTSIRFFLPVLVAGSVLIVRRLWSIRLFAAYASFAAAASILLGTVGLLQQPALPTLASPASWRLASALRGAGLHHGYGGYWESSLTTILTRGEVQTLALAEYPPGTVRPMDWFANLDWYRNAASNWHDRVFFITAEHPGSSLRLNQATIVRHFGTPAQIIRVDDNLIDVYDLRHGVLDRLTPTE